MDRETYHHGDLKNALIEAGIEILAREGVEGLSLRKVASQAGVSHSAPYAHFADKQALIAAISTEGNILVNERLESIQAEYADNPRQALIETCWAYLSFAMEKPAHFKVTFSGVVEKEDEYPALVEITTRNNAAVAKATARCQQAGCLAPGPADLMGVSIWSAVHGLACLLLEGQISHTVLERFTPYQMLEHILNQYFIM